MKKTLPILLLLCLPLFLKAQIITTVCGSGSTLSYSGDWGPATAAELSYPMNIIFDDTGNYYIINALGLAVRKVSVTGIIHTVAGDSLQGYLGDGGAATAAEFNEPNHMVRDTVGNLYISDYTNERIRKVSPSWIVTTLIGNGTPSYTGDGGPASAATMNGPTCLAFDHSGNLYIGERGNNVIRKVTPGGTITTVAGNGSLGYSGDGGQATAAQLNGPYGIAFDAANNMYIADAFNNAIRKVSTLGIITTIAGGGTSGFFGDGGPATAAKLYTPGYPVFDASGNLYFSDGDNNRVRKISTTGIITTIAGNGVNGFWGDGGPATAAELFAPYGLAFDHSGNLYIADNINQRIRKINLGTTELSSVNVPGIIISPNPTYNVINIEAPFIVEKVEIINLIGQTLYSEQYHSNALVINVSRLLPGMYFIKMNDTYTQKIIKQ